MYHKRHGHTARNNKAAVNMSSCDNHAVHLCNTLPVNNIKFYLFFPNNNKEVSVYIDV